MPMAEAWDNAVDTCSTMPLFAQDCDIDAWSRRLFALHGLDGPAWTPPDADDRF